MSARLLLGVTIGAVVVGQMILKTGLHSLYRPPDFSALSLLRTGAFNIVNPYMIASLFCTGVAGLTWLLVIQKMPLNRAYPLMSLNFLTIYILSWLLFGEVLSVYSLVGVLFIVAGTMLLGMR